MEQKLIPSIARIIPGVLLLLALGSLEYSYYQVLRIVVCACSVYLAWYLFNIKQSNWAWGFVGIAIVFNPIFPIYLDKNVWQLIDITASIFIFASFTAEAKK